MFTFLKTLFAKKPHRHQSMVVEFSTVQGEFIKTYTSYEIGNYDLMNDSGVRVKTPEEHLDDDLHGDFIMFGNKRVSTQDIKTVRTLGINTFN